MIDYKDWVQCRADDIATERYGKDYYELDDDDQVAVYEEATNDYTNQFSSELYHIYETAKEAKMLKENGY